MKAYWFSKEDGRTQHLEHPAEVGKTDTFIGEIVPCQAGLHASPTPCDALDYAAGPILWVCELPDDSVAHGNPIDKYAASSRKYLFKIDMTKIMRQFAAQCALGVFDKWSPPDVVREYIEGTAQGEDKSSIRAAARAAAWAATWDAAWDAAWAAAWGTAWDAAWGAARAAAWDAARDAAWDAAWDAARAAAWGAAWAAQRTNFNRLAYGALKDAGYKEAE